MKLEEIINKLLDSTGFSGDKYKFIDDFVVLCFKKYIIEIDKFLTDKQRQKIKGASLNELPELLKKNFGTNDLSSHYVEVVKNNLRELAEKLSVDCPEIEDLS